MTTQQAIAKAMSICSDRLGHVGRNEFLLAMSSTEIALLIAAKIQLARGLKPPRKARPKGGRQTQFNFTNTKNN